MDRLVKRAETHETQDKRKQPSSNFFSRQLDRFNNPEKKLQIEIKEQTENLQAMHKDLKDLQTRLNGLDESINTFAKLQPEIQRINRETEKTLNDFKELINKPEDYRSVLQTFDQEARSIAQEIEQKQQDEEYPEQVTRELDNLKQHMEAITKEMNATPQLQLGQDSQFSHHYEEKHAKLNAESENLQKEWLERQAFPYDTAEVIRLKKRFKSLEAPDFKIQMHYSQLQRALSTLYEYQRRFSAVKERYHKHSENFSQIIEKVLILKTKTSGYNSSETEEMVNHLFQQANEINRALWTITPRYEEHEKNTRDLAALETEIEKKVKDLSKYVKSRSVYYPIDLAEAHDFSGIKALDVTIPLSCTIYSARSLLNHMGIRTTEYGIARQIQWTENRNTGRVITQLKSEVKGLNENYPVYAYICKGNLTTETTKSFLEKGNLLQVGIANWSSIGHVVGVFDMITDRDNGQTFYALYDDMTRDRGTYMLVPDYYINYKARYFVVIEDRQSAAGGAK